MEHESRQMITPFTVIVPVSDPSIFRNNLLSSPLFKEGLDIEILPRYEPVSASKCFNEAMETAKHDILVFVHQDIVFQKDWAYHLFQQMTVLEEEDPDWGVLGCYGMNHDGKGVGYVYCKGNEKILGHEFVKPMKVQTLDEIVLILKKSSGIGFDNNLPHFHFYGADICLEAAEKGKNSYVISAFLHHNSREYKTFPREFFSSYEYFYNKWKRHLPVYTTCVNISSSKFLFYYKHMWRRWMKHSIKDRIMKQSGN
jgi:Glycosyltransferase like family